jgi:hypothetical protein
VVFSRRDRKRDLARKSLGTTDAAAAIPPVEIVAIVLFVGRLLNARRSSGHCVAYSRIGCTSAGMVAFRLASEKRMTDERNIAHDKKVADDKRDQGSTTSPNAAVQPQPGKKPPQVDDDTAPSNSRAREMYKQGEAPRDHAHESRDNPPDDEQRDKPDAPRLDAEER